MIFKRTKHRLTGFLVAGLIASCVAAMPSRAAAEQPGAPESAPLAGIVEGETVRVRGTIVKIDKEHQAVTFKGPRGNTLTLQVKNPANLNAVKVGDEVIANYTQAIAVRLLKPGEAAPSESVIEERVTAKPGEVPHGGIAREVTLTARIEQIDKTAQTVSLLGPDGRSEVVKVRDPQNLERVKVGDEIVITFVQALAIALEKPAGE
jgi:Cu/Ag efflux protein CusF